MFQWSKTAHFLENFGKNESYLRFGKLLSTLWYFEDNEEILCTFFGTFSSPTIWVLTSTVWMPAVLKEILVLRKKKKWWILCTFFVLLFLVHFLPLQEGYFNGWNACYSQRNFYYNHCCCCCWSYCNNSYLRNLTFKRKIPAFVGLLGCWLANLLGQNQFPRMFCKCVRVCVLMPKPMPPPLTLTVTLICLKRKRRQKRKK